MYSVRNIKALKAVILKIQKTWMNKRNELSEFEQGKIAALKRVGKSERNF